MAQSERITTEDDETADALAPGTVLLGDQFTITGYLNRGGFGIVYTGFDRLDRQIVIKECFLDAICERRGTTVVVPEPQDRAAFNGMVQHFVREARLLASFDHPNVVPVNLVFEENGTAYMAMKRIEGSDLQDWIEDEGQPDPDVVVQTLKRVLLALDHVHRQGMLHRDLSPENILLDQTGTPVLIDFGAAKQLGARSEPELRAVKEGYSPPCFYDRSTLDHAPSSDLYSLAATFHHLITGDPPLDAPARVAADRDPYVPLAGRFPAYSPRFLNTIDAALSLDPLDRPQSATEWLTRIDDSRGKVTSLFGAGTPVRLPPAEPLQFNPPKTAIHVAETAEEEATVPAWQLSPIVEWPAFLGAAALAGAAWLGWGTMGGMDDADFAKPGLPAMIASTPASPAAAATAADTADGRPVAVETSRPGQAERTALARPSGDAVPSARPAPLSDSAPVAMPDVAAAPSAPGWTPAMGVRPAPQMADARPGGSAAGTLKSFRPDAAPGTDGVLPARRVPAPGRVIALGALPVAAPAPLAPVAIDHRAPRIRVAAPAFPRPDALSGAGHAAPAPAALFPRPKSRPDVPPLDIAWSVALPFRAALSVDPAEGPVLTVSDAGEAGIPGNAWLAEGAAISSIDGIDVGRLSDALAAPEGGDPTAPFLVLVEARTAPDAPFEERTLTLYRRGLISLASGLTIAATRAGDGWDFTVQDVPVRTGTAVQTGDRIVGALSDGAPVTSLDALAELLDTAEANATSALPVLVDRGAVRTVATLPLAAES